MKLFRIFFCLGATALAFSAAATETAQSPARKRAPVVRPAEPATPAFVPPQASSASGQTTRAVFQILLAEIALQRGDTELSSKAYADLALRTRAPEVLERSIEVAGYARDFDLAIESARLWLEIEPESKQAHYLLTSALILSNRLDALAPELVRMLENDREALPQNILGLNRMFAGNPDRAAVFQLIEEIVKPFADLPEAHYAIAVAANAAKESGRAMSAVQRALELRPDWEMAAFLQGQLLLRESPAKAVLFLEQFVGNNPAAHEARLLLARALVAEKRYGDAQRHFKTLLEALPDNPEVLYPAAILSLQQNALDDAAALLDKFVALDVRDKNFAYYALGQIAEERKRPEEALSYYAKVGEGAQAIPARIRHARLLATRGRLDEARNQLHGVATETPDERIQLAVAEAGLLREAHQLQAAFDLLDEKLATHPEHPELLYESALLAEKLERFDLLEQRLRKLITLHPENAHAYNALGYSFAERGVHLDEARTLIEKALLLAPGDFSIIDSLGWVLFRQGDLDGALKQLERAYAGQHDPEIAIHLAEVLEALGRKEEALRLLRDAREKHPASQLLREALKKRAP